jgi:peptidoglycan/LPS O-acetylase OafA/YrhL
MVLAFHAGLPIRGGYTGVDVFFVISGFVIAGVLLREFESSGTLKLRAFYGRRIRRLGPALAVLVTTVVLLSLILQSPLGPQQTTAATGIGALLTVANAVAYHNGGYFAEFSAANPLLHTWTLSVEEQFYFLFPSVLLILFRLGRPGRGLRTAVVLGAGAALSFGLAIALQRGFVSWGNSSELAFYASPTRAWEFAAGALLALPWVNSRPADRAGGTWYAIGAFIGLVLIGYSAFALDGGSEVPGVDVLPAVAGTVLVIMAGRRSNVVSGLLATGPMMWLGDRSYGIYLWHWPFVVFTVALWGDDPTAQVAATILSIVPAAVSFRYVEVPAGRIDPRHQGRILRLALACVIPPILLCSILWLGANNTWGDPELERVADRRVAWEILVAGCELTGETLYRCDHVLDEDSPDVYFVGDSHAMALSSAVTSASRQLEASLRIRAIGGCPFALFSGEGSRPDASCSTWVEGVLSELDRANPDLLVLHQCGRINTACTVPGGSDAWIPRYVDAVARIVSQVLRQGSQRVLIVQDVPYIENDLSTCATVLEFRGECGRISLAMAKMDSMDLVTAQRKAIPASDRVSYVDLLPVLCQEKECVQVRDGVVLYRDAHHLTVSGGDTLVPLLRRAMAGQLPSPADAAHRQ